MNLNRFQRIFSVLILLALATALVPLAARAEGGNLYVTGYTVTNSGNGTVSAITKNGIANITVSIKDISESSGDKDPADLDISKLDDSFTGGTVSVKKTSQPGQPLSYEVKLTDVRYKGVGQTVRLQVGEKGKPDSYQNLEVTITEAVVYEAPQSVPDTTPEAAPAPMVLISRSDIASPLQPGQEKEIALSFQNLSGIRLKSPVVTLTPSEGLSLTGGSSSFALDDIMPKKTAVLKVRVRAADVIPSSSQSLGVELKFNYYNNLSSVQGSVTDKVTIPAQARESVPQPVVIVSRSPMDTPIAPDETREMTVTFQNAGAAKLVAPVVSVAPSESLMLLNDVSTFLLSDIEPGKSASISLKVKAAKTIASTTQSIATELKYGYDNGTTLTQAAASDKINIPAQARESIPQPVVLVTRSAVDKPISAGETMSLTVTFQNAGAAKLLSPSASVTPSDSLILLNDTSTFLLPDLEPGKSASIPLRVKAAAEISSTTQSIATELKYGYDNGETITQATASDKVNLSANATLKSDVSVPSIVIRSFTYGGPSVAAGSKFPLSFTFENTGKTAIENVVVTVDGGESFTMDGSTNTFYYGSLSAGGTQVQDVPMRTVPTSKSGAQNISVGFKYEYVDGEKRSQASADIKISLPVYQPDRFHINAPTVPESVNVGEEAEILLSYVNKGKDDLANLEATVEGEGVSTPARTQYLGNVTAGTSGNIGFALTPEQEGDIKLVLKISYENGDQQVQTREFPITLRAIDIPPPDDYSPDDLPAEEGGFPVIPAAVGVGVAALAAAVVLVRRKKAAGAAKDSWSDWNDEDSGVSGGEG
ncbi:hypothetical protein [Pseudoflavonifractor capillosus]|uniref:CARDB domain-containing protein n=1 Tax=Pseudoflavonifractor capillosus TaxID=106588 RepID=A0A921MM63_9FIRM|nr:hypothetical protein [Pseudoflavonifractor capillosus]HJG86695.1 hypothetical protein [Pseudoflavonifractor capillosus]